MKENRYGKPTEEDLKEREKQYRLRNRMKTYGITLEYYEQMLEEQNNLCYICKSPPTKNRALCIDHCHETNSVRHLLCDNCNKALGYTKDNTETLQKMIDYIIKFRGSK